MIAAHEQDMRLLMIGDHAEEGEKKMKRLLIVLALAISTSAATANELHKGDVLMFRNDVKGCTDLRDIRSYREAACPVLPKIKWKLVDRALSDGIESAYCIIAAEPMNPTPPEEVIPMTPEEEAKAERDFCIWVRLSNQYGWATGHR
jgi:hypothetical protein